jgi:hypothetical protein
MSMYQDVEVNKLPKREVTVDRSGQGRSFIGDGGYPVLLERLQEPEQFRGKPKVA